VGRAPDLALTTALYRLDRTNTTAPDPSDVTRLVQTGEPAHHRATSWALSGNVTIAWQVAGGYASQRATITNTTAAAPAGATIPLVPVHRLALEQYQLVPALGIGSASSTRPTCTRRSTTASPFRASRGSMAGAYVSLTRYLRAQLNVDNLFDRRYYVTAHSNNNIMPGASRTVRLSLITGL
jgi:catecholate siderophore receptor